MTAVSPSKFTSPAALENAWGVSRSFLWRLEKEGLLAAHYLHSRKLYLAEDIRRVDGMIERGELRAAPRGAAQSKPARNPR